MIGDPAGRTAKHPTAAHAVGRSTERQRLALAPPPGQQWAVVIPQKQAQAQIIRSVLISAALVGIGVFVMSYFTNQWLELLGIPFLVAAVVTAGASRPWQRFRYAPPPEDIPEPHRGSQRR